MSGHKTNFKGRSMKENEIEKRKTETEKEEPGKKIKVMSKCHSVDAGEEKSLATHVPQTCRHENVMIDKTGEKNVFPWEFILNGGAW